MNPLTATSTELRSGAPEAAAVRPPVSVIVPAFNAAATLAEALQSLQAQTHSDWEAIVVDDGSTDETAAIAAEAAAQDSRIRVLTVPHGGVSRARNAGIAAARHEWLLFLDADDWLLPQALELLTEEVGQHPIVELVHGGWTYVAPDGKETPTRYQGATAEQLFATTARTCAFAVDACLVRKSRVLDVGSFDPALATCEEWDLWQRLARASVTTRALKQPVARVRMREGSASFDPGQLLRDGLRVIETGHREDPRVRSPRADLMPGVEPGSLTSTRLAFLAWVSGLALARGEDPLPLLDIARSDPEPGLDPQRFAASLVEAGSLPFRRISEWERVWLREQPRVSALLRTVEERTRAPGYARAVQRALEVLTLSGSGETWPRSLGGTRAEALNVNDAIPDLHLPDDVELLLLGIQVDAADLGVLELPVCDRRVSAAVIADAVAAEFGWTLLRRFFAATVFPQLRLEETAEGLAVWRGALRFPRTIQPGQDGAPLEQALHGAVGWGLFLQELWGRPHWANRRFYELTAEPEATAPVLQVAGSRVVVEVSDELSDLEAQAPWLDVAVTVGGIGAGLIRVPVNDGRVLAHAVCHAITARFGYELCVIAVREALVGRAFSEGGDLRSRLQQRARSTAEDASGSGHPAGVIGRSPVLENARASGERTFILGRRSGPPGTSVSRRASLPIGAIPQLEAAARVAAEPLIIAGDGNEYAAAAYTPDLLCSELQPRTVEASKQVAASPAHGSPAGDRHYFESIFVGSADPWRYTSSYEQVKYEQTLALLPDERLDVVLELACAEGHFTHQLAARAGRVIAADISAVALTRAAARCADRPNVEFRRLDLFRDTLPGAVDLIVCSEVLYYAGDRASLARVARSFSDALRDGGHLLMAHAQVLVDDSTSTGFDWDVPYGARFFREFIPTQAPFRLVRELCTDLYRIQLFRKEPEEALRAQPVIVDSAEHGVLPQAVAEQVRWGGGSPVATWPRLATSQLPVLCYHRVSPTGTDRVPGLRVAPEAFDEQLHYLADSGFRCLSLDDWRSAAAAKSPIPGRAVVLTFDDGYVDFAEYAWPLLQKHGFTASLFVVTDLVGDRSRWDSALGEDAPLLDWSELRRLHGEGVEIGSHSATHRPLVGLSNVDVVREAASSRARLIQELEAPVHAFAYPFGLTSKVVQHLVGACGFLYGLTTVDRFARYQDPLLALPRRAVPGSATLSSFIKRLPG